MDFQLSDERRMLAETAERFLADRYSMATRQANAAQDGGFNPETWQELAELGLIGALLPPSVGGYGGTGEDIAVVFEALGGGLVVEPFLATGVLGAAPLYLSAGSADEAFFEPIIAGTQTLALAHGEPGSRYNLSDVTTRATPDGDDWRLDGSKAVVLNGDTADKLVVSARIDGDRNAHRGLALFLVDGNADGVSRRGSGTIDGLHTAEVTLGSVRVGPDALVGEAGAAYPIIEVTVARGVLALCAEAIGIMDKMHATTLDYLKTRTQFGRPIGTFQVLQHRFVDMTLEIEQARSLVMLAATVVESDDRLEREKTISAAKQIVGRVGRLVAEECIQMHGGIAMTWEYDLPHYAKRLTMIDHQLGDTDFHLARFTALAG